MFFLLIACTRFADVARERPQDTAPDDVGGTDALDPFYAPERVLEVTLTVDEGDWDTLCHEKRNLLEEITGDCLSTPFESPYTWFPATATIDGQPLDQPIGLRKKGLIGSESSVKPSLKLKLKLNEYEDQDLDGLTRLTLNNARQDPSHIDQCLGYARFRAAGLPAARCSFAHVTVNGEDLGIYVNVEPAKKPLLRRWFDDDEGNLYEGTLSDFREGWTGTFDRKTNTSDPDRSDLETVVQALQADDEALLDELDQVIDLDQYLRFWAMESLVAHWDGYDGNTNNFYVYRDPTDDRFRFIPWGADALFDGQDVFGTGHAAVMANSGLSNRLIQHEQGAALYAEAMQELLDTAWDEDEILAEIDGDTELLRPYLADDERTDFFSAVATIREFVDGRRDVIEDDLSDWPPRWQGELGDVPCLQVVGSVESSFSTTMGSTESADWWGAGTADPSITVWDATYPSLASSAVVGAMDGGEDDDVYLFIMSQVDSATVLYPYLLLDQSQLTPGTYDIDWEQVQGWLGYSSADTDWAVGAYLWQGTLVLDQASALPGSTVSGHFSVQAWGG